MLRVGVLGPVTAWEGDEELRLGQPRQQAVLGILAMRANRVISRTELVDAVWGHDAPPSAEGGIYTYIAGLRRIVEPGRSARGQGRVLVSTGAGYVLHLVPGQPDAVAFEQHLGRARQLRQGGDLAGAASSLEAALGLWRGVAFAGVPGPFAETERARLAELRFLAAEERADVLLALGRHDEVVPDLTAMVADQPLRERMRALLMIALWCCAIGIRTIPKEVASPDLTVWLAALLIQSIQYVAALLVSLTSAFNLPASLLIRRPSGLTEPAAPV